MNDIVGINKITREQVLALQHEAAKLPQVELKTNHYFADGMYCREVFRAAGTLIVGKIHKREHIFAILQGTVRMTTDEGVRDISAPAILVSKPGTKRATYALTDATCVTVHRTEKTDLDELEAELVEPDPTARFTSGNLEKPNMKELKGKPSKNKGVPASEASKLKNRNSHLGKTPWNKGNVKGVKQHA